VLVHWEGLTVCWHPTYSEDPPNQEAMTKVFIIGNKNLLEVMDKYDKQDISEISDQIQNNLNCFEIFL
jgi:hypothetical protein